MNYNQTEVWPFNLLCRVFDPEELQALKADPPADLNAFLVYVVREMYSNIDADVIILHYMGQMSHEGIAEMLKVSDEQIADTVAEVYERTGYLLDPHGACGYRALAEGLQPGEQGVFLETAHPAKFRDTVESIIKAEVAIPEKLQAFMRGTKQNVPMTAQFDDFKAYLMSR